VSANEQRFAELAKTNPLFGPRQLKLGTFCSNSNGGATMSSMEGVLKVSWENTATLAAMAEQMEFEAIVPIGRWRGFGGDTDFGGESFECVTFCAGISAQTKYSSVFATVHVPSLHPVMAAKQGATLDHISGGRFTLNIVTGWNKREIELFGSPMMEHDERYVAAAEWIDVMKQLWTRESPVDFDGKYYSIHDAYLRPRPIQPFPALMSAGASKMGRLFAAKHCDIAFTSLAGRDPVSIRERLESYRKLARDEFGRELKIWINAYMIIGDTEQDAQRQYDHCIHEKGDWRGAENMLRELGLGAQTHTADQLQMLKQDFMAGWAGFRLQGTPQRIVDDFKMLSEAGVDGILLSWPAYLDGMKRFRAEVYPLLIQEGLR
jgi:FMNH2-dependent dimethyl sulfone monooxygenase